MLVHGDNLRQKEAHLRKYRDKVSRQYLIEIRAEYDKWRVANEVLIGPGKTPSNEIDKEIVYKRVKLFEAYKDFIDQQRYAETFDSRSNLHSSVLEEFMYYLFRDLVRDFGQNALIGKSHTFKDLFFVPPGYVGMLRRPHGMIEKKHHDFVIGATIEATLRTITQSSVGGVLGDEVAIIAEKPSDYEDVGITSNTETHKFDIPAIVIECKTYLDKTMLEGSSRAAEDLKARNPNSLYIVVMEFIKLTEAVNLHKYKLDQMYVLRQQKNTDREFRYVESWVKNPVNPDVVCHLFDLVRSHLITDWARNLTDGIQRGWLL